MSKTNIKFGNQLESMEHILQTYIPESEPLIKEQKKQRYKGQKKKHSLKGGTSQTNVNLTQESLHTLTMENATLESIQSIQNSITPEKVKIRTANYSLPSIRDFTAKVMPSDNKLSSKRLASVAELKTIFKNTNTFEKTN